VLTRPACCMVSITVPKIMLLLNEKTHETAVARMREIFDAEPPYTPRRCCAQGWTVADYIDDGHRLNAPRSEIGYEHVVSVAVVAWIPRGENHYIDDISPRKVARARREHCANKPPSASSAWRRSVSRRSDGHDTVASNSLKHCAPGRIARRIAPLIAARSVRQHDESVGRTGPVPRFCGLGSRSFVDIAVYTYF
jgi:hypothetical protein